MPHVVNTDALIAEGVLNTAQAEEIIRRSRETMLALVINIVLTAGIIAASLGLVFWIANAAGVAALGFFFLIVGGVILARDNELYRMLGSAAALVGAGMLFAGGGIELVDKYPDIAGWTLLLAGIATVGVFLATFFRGPQTLRFVTGAIALMGLALHLVGVGILFDVVSITNWVQSIHFLYAAVAVAGIGTAINVRVVTAAAIILFPTR